MRGYCGTGEDRTEGVCVWHRGRENVVIDGSGRF